MTQASAALKLREYETVFLLKPELPDEVVDQTKERVRTIVNREGGKLLRFTTWGKKRTMYPVKAQPRAIYIHALYLGGPALVSELERNLRNLDNVLRYLSVRLADDIDPDTRPVSEDIKLSGDIDDNRPLGGAERDAERAEMGVFDGDGDDDDDMGDDL
ncbi:MAG: 30S ribosomal protein S6 [Cystobacterineae bacterium]|nr:30S ribosomal protein S6 [Cystobacterineae bacterium]